MTLGLRQSSRDQNALVSETKCILQLPDYHEGAIQQTSTLKITKYYLPDSNCQCNRSNGTSTSELHEHSMRGTNQPR